MLNIQNYLFNGGTLQSLNQKYNISYIFSPSLNMVSLNYQLLSPDSDPLVPECRALFLEINTWNIAFKSMGAFYEFNDPRSIEAFKNFDWESARAYEKRDGALIAIYYYKDEWRIGTRFAADGGWLAYGLNGIKHNFTWKELVLETIKDMGIKWEDFVKQLDPNIYYSFEICSPENRVGVVYNERTLTLIAAVDKNTLNELDIINVSCPTPKASFTIVQNIEDVLNLIQSGKEAHQMEGFVLCDKNFIRAKVYNPNYIETMNVFGQQSELQQLSSLIRFNTHSVSHINLYIFSMPLGMEKMYDPLIDDTKPNMLFRTLEMCKHINNNYEKIASGENIDTSLWPEAYEEMKNGSCITTIIDKVPEEKILEVLHRYESSLAE